MRAALSGDLIAISMRSSSVPTKRMVTVFPSLLTSAGRCVASVIFFGFIRFSLTRFVWSLPIIGKNGGGVNSSLIPRVAANLSNFLSCLSRGSECQN